MSDLNILKRQQTILEDHFTSNDFSKVDDDLNEANLVQDNLKEGLKKLRKLEVSKNTKALRKKQMALFDIAIDALQLIIMGKPDQAEDRMVVLQAANLSFNLECERITELYK